MNDKVTHHRLHLYSILLIIAISLIGGLFVPVYGFKALLLIPGILMGWRLVRHPIDAFCAYLVTVPLSTASEQIFGFSITKAAFAVLVISWLFTFKWHTLKKGSDIEFWGAVFITACIG